MQQINFYGSDDSIAVIAYTHDISIDRWMDGTKPGEKVLVLVLGIGTSSFYILVYSIVYAREEKVGGTTN